MHGAHKQASQQHPQKDGRRGWSPFGDAPCDRTILGYFFSPKNIRDVVQQTPMCTCHPEQLAVLIFLRDRSSGYVHGNVLTHAYQRTTQSSSTPTCHVSLRCSILFPPKVQLFSSTPDSRVSGRTRFVASTLSLPTHAPPPLHQQRTHGSIPVWNVPPPSILLLPVHVGPFSPERDQAGQGG